MSSEYQEIVKKIPASEQPIGPLAGLATRLDYLGPKVEKLITLSPQMDALAEKVNKVECALSQLELPEGVTMPQRIVQLSFTYNLAALQGVMLEEDAPFAGYIKQVSIHWPPGCEAFVDVKVGHGVEQFCPREGYLALDNVTPTYPFSEWVNDHDVIWVSMENHDSVNSHNITCTIILEGTE